MSEFKIGDRVRVKCKCGDDIWVPDINLAIDYDGKQHFGPVKAWGGKRNFKNIKYRDNIKNEYFKNHPEIIFVRISYTEKNPLEYIKKILYDKDLIKVR